MIIHVQYITVTLHSSISRKDPIFFFIYSNNVSWMAVYHYTIYNTSIYVKTSKDWFIFYILEKNGTKEF